MGRADFKHYISALKMEESTVQQKLYVLPVIVAHYGWGLLEICLGSTIEKTNEFLMKLKYEKSFEAQAWQIGIAKSKNILIRANSPTAKRKETQHDKDENAKLFTVSTWKYPGCVLAAGFIAGFAGACYNLDFIALELSCCGGSTEHNMSESQYSVKKTDKESNGCSIIVSVAEKLEEYLRSPESKHSGSPMKESQSSEEDQTIFQSLIKSSLSTTKARKSTLF